VTTLIRTAFIVGAMLALAQLVSAQSPETIDSSSIDMPGYLRIAAEAAAHRERHRVTEREFATRTSSCISPAPST
jgi:hypothetical protein